MNKPSDNAVRRAHELVEELNEADKEARQFAAADLPYAVNKADPQQKPTNPKDALGSTRVPLSLVSGAAMAEEALAMAEGALKYGRYNYRGIGVRTSIYLDAAFRHLFRYLNGEDRDPKTGVHHLGYARACMGILLDATAMGKLTDDRPPASPGTVELIDQMEHYIKHLAELFASYDPKHWTIWDLPIDQERATPGSQPTAALHFTQDGCPFRFPDGAHCIFVAGHDGPHEFD